MTSDVSPQDFEEGGRPEFPGYQVRHLEIVNRKGLHARATAKLVQCIDGFDADVLISKGGETVGGTSIMGILTLGAGIGSIITVAVRGAEADAAMAAITALVADRFGEEE